jgi:hypothetical protein
MDVYICNITKQHQQIATKIDNNNWWKKCKKMDEGMKGWREEGRKWERPWHAMECQFICEERKSEVGHNFPLQLNPCQYSFSCEQSCQKSRNELRIPIYSLFIFTSFSSFQIP